MTTSADQTAIVWKTTDFSEMQVFQHESKRWVWDAAFSADSQYIFTGKYILTIDSINIILLSTQIMPKDP